MKNKTRKKIGRNEKCPCGSGKKYKHCCLKKGIKFVSVSKLGNYIRLVNMDVTKLKSAVRPLKILHSKREKNAQILKKLCPYFKNMDGIGICKKFNVICRSWECDFLERCKSKCIENCPANAEEAKSINGVPNELKKALKVCNERIEKLKNELEPDEIISYLTDSLEMCAAEALTTSPSELISIVKIREWMYSNFGDLIDYNFICEIKEKAKYNELWHFLIERLILEENISIYENGDAILIITPKGRDELQKIAEDPLYKHKELTQKILEYRKNPEKGDEIFMREHCQNQFWSHKMKKVIKWCMVNNLDPKPGGETFNQRYREIIKHIGEVGERSEINPSECLNFGWPLFITFFQTYRYCALTFPWLSEVIESYKGTEFEKSIFEKYGFSPWFWDNFVFNIPWPENDPLSRKLKLFSSTHDFEFEQNERWPIDDGNYSLNLSKLIIGYGLKYYDEIFTIPKITGNWFENVIYSDLLLRSIPVKKRNYKLPNRLGDIDILAFDVYWNYLIEAKDWGPRGKKGYFSSKDYEERLEEMKNEIDKLNNRIEWVKNNRVKLNIPDQTGIIGLFVTSFEEPHISTPKEIIHVPHNKLCAIIGGEPINPILSAKDHPIKLEIPDKVKEIKNDKYVKKEDMKIIQPKGKEKKIKDFIIDRIIQIFGNVNAYHAFRAIYEITEAYRLKGVSVKELSANWIERPPILTKQYISFILFRCDDLSLEDLKEAFELLNQKGLIKETRNQLILEKVPNCEYWKLKDDRMIQVEEKDDADVIINLSEPTEIAEGIILVGMSPPIIKTSKRIELMDIRYF